VILQQLYKDAEAILGESLPPSMYNWKAIRYVIPLTKAGKLAGDFISLPGKRGTLRVVPDVGRTIVIRPILLADKSAYVLGVDLGETNVAKKHAAFKEMVHRCAEETGDPLVRSVDTFLQSWDPELGPIPADLAKDDLLTFEVEGQRPTDSPAVRAFWAQNAKSEEEGEETPTGQCLVTGTIGTIEKRLPGLIKRIPGGQPSGIALVSANSNAFESYGLKESRTSPICREAAERFTKALNHLIAGERTHLTVGNLIYVFWTKAGTDDGFFSFLDRPDPKQVHNLLDCYRSGRPYTFHDEDAFYAFALSASGGRAVIRDWLETTVRVARNHLARWFDAQRMISTDGQPGDSFSIYRLAAGLYRDPRKDMVVQAPQQLMRAALHGDPLPTSLLHQAVIRNRIEQRVVRSRAALIKAVLVTEAVDEHTREERATAMSTLDLHNTEPAYLCGRLLAELEVVQRAALGRINATLTDRYFGGASTTPATVFGVLLTNANKAHLPKIRKQSQATYNALQRRLAEIMLPLTEFPPTLTLKQQALFSLGYYHQRAKNLADALAAKERKQATSSPTDVLIDIEEITEEVE